MQRLLYLAIVVMYLLHQDFWFWDDATLVFGVVPVGFLYHIVYCFAASALLFALTRLAWPSHLEEEVQEVSQAEGQS